jgi:hypothetical protein
MEHDEEVQKLGPEHTADLWTDRNGVLWRHSDAAGWQRRADGWVGSYLTVEGAPPYRRCV